MHLLHILFFTSYVAYYYRFGTKSISMTTEVHKYSYYGFYVFMLGTALPFLMGEPGQLFFGIGSYYLAGWFLIGAGTTWEHQKPVTKQAHHALSFFAIAFGFYAVGSWLAVGIFVALCLVAYILDQKRLLWWLEVVAFYTIKGFQIIGL